MKNIHVLPTDKPSRLYYSGNNADLILSKELISFKTFERSPQYFYITSNEEIKMDDWYLDDTNSVRQAITECESYWTHRKKYQKIILTTDQDLIKDGVQAIDDEFLEWFVKNPSCEEVEIINEQYTQNYHKDIWYNRHKIIIPKEVQCTCKEHDPYCCQIHGNCPTCVKKEKPKQETPEEAAERLYPIPKGGSIWNPSEDDCIKANKQEGFIEGTKWQAERMYSEEVYACTKKLRLMTCSQHLDKSFTYSRISQNLLLKIVIRFV